MTRQAGVAGGAGGHAGPHTAGGANHVQVARTTIEGDPGGRPRVGAPEQDDEGALGHCDLGAAGRVLVGVLGRTGDEAPVALRWLPSRNRAKASRE